MSAPIRYRVTSTQPYLDREDEYAALTMLGAAQQAEELTGVGADVILSDLEEFAEETPPRRPWEFVDPETGHEVTVREEVA